MDILVVLLIIIIGIVWTRSQAKTMGTYFGKHLGYLFVFHLIMGTYYSFFVAGDAIGHWLLAKKMTEQDFFFALTEIGSHFTRALNYYPSGVLDLSYFTGTMMYSLIGFIGLTFFYKIVLQLIPHNTKYKGLTLFPLLFYFPNIHFWSCAVGKDTLLFFAIGAFSYALLQLKTRLLLLIISVVLMFFIRPHIILFLLIAFGMAYVLGGKISKGKRIFFSVLLIGAAVAILPTVLEFTKIEEASAESFDKFAASKSDALSRSHTGSAVNISSYPLPLKILTFLYRPFFFDINGVPAVIASFENLLLVMLSYTVLFKHRFKRNFKAAPFVIKAFVFFLLIGTLAFSQSLGNVGIMIRMRNMFLPGMMIYILWSFSYERFKYIQYRKHKEIQQKLNV